MFTENEEQLFAADTMNSEPAYALSKNDNEDVVPVTLPSELSNNEVKNNKETTLPTTLDS